jgi:hypothetical protein
MRCRAGWFGLGLLVGLVRSGPAQASVPEFNLDKECRHKDAFATNDSLRELVERAERAHAIDPLLYEEDARVDILCELKLLLEDVDRDLLARLYYLEASWRYAAGYEGWEAMLVAVAQAKPDFEPPDWEPAGMVSKRELVPGQRFALPEAGDWVVDGNPELERFSLSGRGEFGFHFFQRPGRNWVLRTDGRLPEAMCADYGTDAPYVCVPSARVVGRSKALGLRRTGQLMTAGGGGAGAASLAVGLTLFAVEPRRDNATDAAIAAQVTAYSLAGVGAAVFVAGLVLDAKGARDIRVLLRPRLEDSGGTVSVGGTF